MCEFLRSRL